MPRPSLVPVAIALLAFAPGCVVRPPPIKSPPVAPERAPAGASACTVSHGIDTAGNPGCSAGCTWNLVQKQCIPDKAPGWTPPEGI